MPKGQLEDGVPFCGDVRSRVVMWNAKQREKEKGNKHRQAEDATRTRKRKKLNYANKKEASVRTFCSPCSTPVSILWTLRWSSSSKSST